MFLRGKKGVGMGMLVSIVLVVFLIFVVIVALSGGFKNFNKTTKELSSCSGLGIADGICVANKNSCDALAIEGLGCTGEKPVCCASEKGSSAAASNNVAAGCPSTSSAPGWQDPSCKVALSSIETSTYTNYNDDPAPGEPNKVVLTYITCKTNTAYTPCVGAKIISGANTKKCNFVTDTKVDPQTSTFNCGTVTGSAQAICELNYETESKCGVDPQNNLKSKNI